MSSWVPAQMSPLSLRTYSCRCDSSGTNTPSSGEGGEGERGRGGEGERGRGGEGERGRGRERGRGGEEQLPISNTRLHMDNVIHK